MTKNKNQATKKWKKLSKKQAERIKRWKKVGVTVREIARFLNISEQAVRYQLKKKDHKRRWLF